MAKQMMVSVTLRKPVADSDKANDFIDDIREIMGPYDDIVINGFCSKPLEDAPTPPK